jgi:hypothetical protein
MRVSITHLMGEFGLRASGIYLKGKEEEGV